MKEIAYCVLKYISLFGPPKIILSDQGQEFSNSLVKSLLNLTGTVHVVTSPYKPSTNGKVERQNGIISQMIRKHVGEKRTDWPKYIPWIQYCLNTRNHSTTDYRADELFFGRRMNGFENFDIINFDENRMACYIKRAYELQELWEDKLPKAIENTKKSQVWQKDAQNKRHKVDTELLPLNSKLYVKIEGTKDKLHPKYIGPYKVLKYAKNDKYILSNILGEKLSTQFIRERLKANKL